MRVLVACEFSGVVRDAFIAKGHDAISCDLLPTDKPGPHHQGDIFEIVDDGWDMMIAHPPCTYLANSGVQWLTRGSDDEQHERWLRLADGAEFFRLLKGLPIPKIAVENPIPHKYAVERIGSKYDQLVQPWMFGHAESKATCLWLKGLEPLTETDNVKEVMKSLPKSEAQRLHWLPPGPERAKLRSTTFQGLADAMADQWG